MLVCLEPMNFSVVTDMSLLLKYSEHSKEAGKYTLMVNPYQAGVVFAECSRRVLQMIVRDLDEQMVDLVSSNVVCQMMGPTVVSVNTRELACGYKKQCKYVILVHWRVLGCREASPIADQFSSFSCNFGGIFSKQKVARWRNYWILHFCHRSVNRFSAHLIGSVVRGGGRN